MNTRYPEVEIVLAGEHEPEGNAFYILGQVQRGLKQHGVDQSEINRFFDEATSGDYQTLLETIENWVTVY